MHKEQVILGILIFIIAWMFCRWLLKVMQLKPKDTDRTLEEIDQMSGKEFELFTAAVLRGNGFIIEEMTKGTGDYGYYCKFPEYKNCHTV